MNSVAKQFALCLVFFTRIRLPAVLDLSSVTLASGVWAFPLVGLLVGGVGAAILWGGQQIGLSALVTAFLVVAAQVWFTGGLHEDGLADSADGMASHRSKEEKLAILRDSHIGTFGVLALIVVLGLRVSLLTELQNVHALLLAALMSRLGMALLMFISPQARSEGLSAVAGTPKPFAITAAFFMAILSGVYLVGAPVTLGVFVLLLSAVWAMKQLAMQHFGGITGDVIGACQQLSEVALLLMLAVIAAH